MTLATDIELANTQKKLRLLEQQYHETQSDAAEDPELRDVTLFSLKQLINQLKEEIAIYRAHHQPATP